MNVSAHRPYQRAQGTSESVSARASGAGAQGATAWTAASSPAPNSTLDFERLLQQRYSCRAFERTRPLTPHYIELIMEALTCAPSACNLQPYHFAVVTGQALSTVETLRNFYGAPALLIGCFDPNHPGYTSPQGQDFKLFDLGLALLCAALRATELGLGSCFIGSLPVAELKAALHLEYEPVIALALGYARPDAAPSDQHFTRRRGPELYTVYD